MNFRLNIPSLEQMTLIKIAIELWNQEHIKALMRIFYKSLDSDTTLVNYVRNWGQIKKAVVRKVRRLSQPRLLEEKITTFIKTVDSQILSWMDYHRFLSPQLDLPKKFCWTLHGTIDAKKTAEVFVKNCNLDVSSRFKLACVYCLEGDISALWKKLPENFKMDCQNRPGQHGLVVFWTSVMNRELHKIYESSSSDPNPLTPNQYAFQIAVRFSSRAAVEYFLKKMTPSQREESLHRFARCASNNSFQYHFMSYEEIKADVLLFLLSELGERDKLEVFKNDDCEILYCFLQWPRQGLFMETASYAMKFLPMRVFFPLLVRIAEKIFDSKDYNYREMFIEFWKQTKDFYKMCAIEHYGLTEYMPLRSLLSVLFRMDEVEITSLILKSMTESQRERVIYSEKGKEICERLYSRSKWDLLKFFIGECIPSKNISFKEGLEACLNVKENSNKFLQLIELLCKDEDRMRE